MAHLMDKRVPQPVSTVQDLGRQLDPAAAVCPLHRALPLLHLAFEDAGAGSLGQPRTPDHLHLTGQLVVEGSAVVKAVKLVGQLHLVAGVLFQVLDGLRVTPVTK